jgi:hypothetical protein
MLTWPHDAGDWAAVLADVEPVFFSIALLMGRGCRPVTPISW